MAKQVSIHHHYTDGTHFSHLWLQQVRTKAGPKDAGSEGVLISCERRGSR